MLCACLPLIQPLILIDPPSLFLGMGRGEGEEPALAFVCTCTEGLAPTRDIGERTHWSTSSVWQPLQGGLDQRRQACAVVNQQPAGPNHIGLGVIIVNQICQAFTIIDTTRYVHGQRSKRRKRRKGQTEKGKRRENQGEGGQTSPNTRSCLFHVSPQVKGGGCTPQGGIWETLQHIEQPRPHKRNPPKLQTDAFCARPSTFALFYPSASKCLQKTPSQISKRTGGLVHRMLADIDVAARLGQAHTSVERA